MLAYGYILLAVAQLPTVPSRNVTEEIQKKAVAATVKVVTAAGHASGAIVGREGQFVYVLTARHVVDKAKTVDIQIFSATSYPRPEKVYTATVLATGTGADLALVRVITRDPLPEPLTICPAAALPKGKNVPALSVGCAPGAVPSPAAETLRRRKHIRREQADEGSWCWEVERKQEVGRSGGPLVDTTGRLIGIATGQDGEHGYYVHADEIYPFLKRSGFRALYEKESR